jgi:hypothetical protein
MTPGPRHPALSRPLFRPFPGAPAGTAAAAKIMPPTLPETLPRLAAAHLVSRPQGQHSDLTGLPFDVSFLAMCTIPSVTADLSSCVLNRQGGPSYKRNRQLGRHITRILELLGRVFTSSFTPHPTLVLIPVIQPLVSVTPFDSQSWAGPFHSLLVYI